MGHVLLAISLEWVNVKINDNGFGADQSMILDPTGPPRPAPSTTADFEQAVHGKLPPGPACRSTHGE